MSIMLHRERARGAPIHLALCSLIPIFKKHTQKQQQQQQIKLLTP